MTEGRGYLAGEDELSEEDLAIADRFNSDPYVVREVWPVLLYQRARARLQAEARYAAAKAPAAGMPR